jgi:cytochrome c oxidase assembly protein subunit 15
MKLFRGLTVAALAVCFAVVVLGAYVRLSDAGLGCPDWPGCYGHLTVPDAPAHLEQAQRQFPDRPMVAHKAWKEMAHRYLASSLGLLILGLFALSFRDGVPRALPRFLLALVVFQGLLGMWTVTLLLKPVIVTAHLLGGMATLALLCWQFWEAREAGRATREASGTGNELARRLDPHAGDFRNEREAWTGVQGGGDGAGLPQAPAGTRPLATLGLALLAAQIFLGGWTSSNYAAVACPDLPTCQGQWWPQLDLQEAFTLWRGLGVNYEYGVLDNRARVTIHHLHRVGAAVVSFVLIVLGALLYRRGEGAWRRFGAAVFLSLAAQALLGAGMILLHFPLPVAAAHNAGAALLLLVMVSLNHFAWRRA